MMVGNGDKISSLDYCIDVPLILEDAEFKVHLLVMPIHRVEIVSGIQWLRTLGAIVAEFVVPCMMFNHGETMLTLTVMGCYY